jgi:signal transduction histidine kinase
MAPDRRGARLTGTVRFRITLAAALAVAVVLGLTGVWLVAHQRQVLTENLDDTLVVQARALAGTAHDGQVPATLVPVADDDGIAQVVDASGQVVSSTPSLEGRPPVAPAPSGDAAVVRTVDDPALEGPFHVASVRGTDAGGDPIVVHVGAPLDDIVDSTRILTRSLVLAVPAVTLLLAALVWALVGRTLRPVEAIRREVDGIGASGLDRRVPVPEADDEVGRLARTMNAMLDRIEDGTLRQRRFVADASHELRSPLARIRAEIEVDLEHPDGADPAATSRSVLAETIGMQHLVDDLLALARSDAGAAVRARITPVDLDDVVDRQARRLRADGRVAVDSTGVSAARVLGDAEQLARAVGNVVDNAVRHARTTVALSVAASGDDAVVAVSDDGPGIPPERRDEVFERFTRLDGARAAGEGGTGLGLAIARDVVVAHGGTIAVDPDHHPGARFVITLPRAPE